MADEKRKILVSVEHNLDRYRKEAVDTAKRVDELKSSLKSLQEQDKANSKELQNAQKEYEKVRKALDEVADGTEEANKLKEEEAKLSKQVSELESKNAEAKDRNAQATEKLKEELRGANADYRNATKSVDDLTRANNANEGSYEQLQAELRLAEKALKEQSGLLIQNADGTFELSDGYVEASQSVEQARAAVQKFNLGIHQGNTNVGLYGEAIDKSLSKVRIFGMDGSKAMGMMEGGIKGMVTTGIKQLGVLTKAFLTNPIGIVIMAIVGAIALLKKAWDSFAGRYFKQMDSMKATVEALGAAWDAVVDRIVNFFTNGDKAAKSVKEVYEETRRLALEARELADRMKAFEAESSKARLEITKLELVYKDLTNTDEERFEAAQKAMAIEEQRISDQLEMAQRNLEIIKEKNALTKSGREDVEAEIEAQSRVYDLEEASLKKRVEMNSQLKSLQMAIQKDAEDAAKRNAEIRQKSLQTDIALMKLRSDESLKSQLAILEAEKNLAIESKELTSKEKLLIEETYLAKVRELNAAEIKNESDEAAELMALEMQIKQADYDAEARFAEIKENLRREARDKRKADAETAAAIEFENEYDLGLLRGEMMFTLRAEQLEAQRKQEIAAAERVGADTHLINKKFTELNKKLKEEEVQYKLGLAADFAHNLATIFGENTKVGKMAASAGIAIDTIQGAIAAYKSLAGIPYVGPVLGAAAATAVGVMGAKAIKDVWKVKSGLPGDGGGGGGSAAPAIEAPTPTRSTGYIATRATQATQDSSVGIQSSTVSTIGSRAIQADATTDRMADRMSSAIREMPAPRVAVEDIRRTENDMQFAETQGVL